MKYPSTADAKRLIGNAIRTTDGLIQVTTNPTREQRDALLALGLNAALQERATAPADAQPARRPA